MLPARDGESRAHPQRHSLHRLPAGLSVLESRVLMHEDVDAMMKCAQCLADLPHQEGVLTVDSLLTQVRALGWLNVPPPVLTLRIYPQNAPERSVRATCTRLSRNSITFVTREGQTLRTPDLRGAEKITSIAVSPRPYSHMIRLVYRSGEEWTIAATSIPGSVTSVTETAISPDTTLRRVIGPEHATAQLALWFHNEVSLFGVLALFHTPVGARIRGTLKNLKSGSGCPPLGDFALQSVDDSKVTLYLPPMARAQEIIMTLDLITGKGGLDVELEDCTLRITDRL